MAALIVTSFGGAVGAVGAQQSTADASIAADIPDGVDQAVQPANETNASNESEQFDLDADMVNRCGVTCRTVSANLTNVGNDTARNVTTVTNITVDGDLIWNRTDELGNLTVNESVERTDDLSISFGDVLRIDRNDGWITINTTVYWDGGNHTFTERRQVM